MTVISVTARVPSRSTGRPPVVFVHGAGTSGSVWTFWEVAFAEAGWPTFNLDLRGHGDSAAVDLSRVGIFEYVDDVNAVARQLDAPPVVVGWSMGGHIAVIAASRGGYAGCVALDPDPPADRVDESVEMVYGVQTPAEIGYTLDGDPFLLPYMPDLTVEERRIAQSSLCSESMLVGCQRRRGILIEQMPCPMLEIMGGLDGYYPTEPSYRGVGLADDQVVVRDSSHWGLVLSRRVLADLVPGVPDWLDGNL